MKLLVSPSNLQEAKAAIEGGADIVDVKNPREGSLGANFPWVIKEIKSILPRGIELSATLGDLNFKPGTASLAAYGAASLGVDYIKAGFFKIAEKKEAQELASKISNAVQNFDVKVVFAGYADYRSTGSISPFLLPEVASEAGAHVVMIDTARKNKSLLNYFKVAELEKFIHLAHGYDLKAALAGSLKISDIKLLKNTDVDVIGVRSLVCIGDRINGRISAKKVRTLKEFLGHEE